MSKPPGDQPPTAISRRRRERRWRSSPSCELVLIPFLLVFALVLHDDPFSASASTLTSASTSQPQAAPAPHEDPYTHTPATALDRYGSSLQLRYAREASRRRGSAVVACLCRSGEGDGTIEDAVVICSLRLVRPDVCDDDDDDDTSDDSPSFSSSAATGLVRILSIDDDEDPADSSTTAVVLTGLRADATYVLRLLRSHAARAWFRYGTAASPDLVAGALGEILWGFFGYDRAGEVQRVAGGLGPVVPEEEDEGDVVGSVMGRPLGVSALVVGVGEVNRRRRRCGQGGDNARAALDQATLREVDATGSSESYVGRAAGFGSDRANALLERRWRAGMTAEDAREVCTDILHEVGKEVGWLIPGDDGGDESALTGGDRARRRARAEIVCETLSRKGLIVERRHLV